MIKMSIIIFILCVLFCVSAFSLYAKDRSLWHPVKRDNTCEDSVYLKECDINDEGEHLLLYRAKINQIIATFQTKCDYESIRYWWTLNDDISDKPLVDIEAHNIFHIEPFSLKKGVYGVALVVTLTRKGKENDVLAGCGFKIISLDPIPTIIGGSERVVEVAKNMVFDGSQSVDRDVPAGKPSTLVYQWKCENIPDAEKICKSDENRLVISAKHATKDLKFTVYLSVRNKDSTKWITVKQDITVLEKTSILEIICEKNCPPVSTKTNRKSVTFLRAKCLEHCEKIEPSLYEWTIENFNYENTQFGRNTDKFVINKLVLEQDKEYKVTLGLKDRKGSASIILKVPSPIKIESCQVKPSQGKALETKFKVDCKFSGNAYTFEIFSVKENVSVPLTVNYKIEKLDFMLAPNSDVFIKIVDQDGYEDVFKLNVQVESGKIENAEAKIEQMLKNGDLDGAIQTTNALDNIGAKNKEEILKKFKQVSIESLEGSRQIASIVTKLVQDSESDPFRGKIATELCTKASNVGLKELKHEYYTTSLSVEVEEATKTLMMCGETDLKENQKILVPEALDFQVTTQFPEVTLSVIEENYPDYDTVEVADKKKKYSQISENVIQICSNNLEMIKLTTIEGEKPNIVSTKSCTAQVSKFAGKDLSEIKINGGVVKPSLDLDGEHTVTVMVCTWTNNPFWWNSTKIILTNVILLTILKNDKLVTNFTNANEIVLKTHDNQVKNIKIKNFDIDSKTTIRIDVKANEPFFIQFHKIPRNSLKVLVTSFKKIDSKEIESKGTVITPEDNVLYQKETNGFDSWYYISFLTKETITVAISVHTVSCQTWIISQKAWSGACKSDSADKSQIICKCSHLSILAGAAYNNEIKLDKLTTNPDFEMVLQRSLIIFIATAVVFFLYCLLLICGRKKKEMNRVYFPGDISANARYIYLIAIETGKQPSSGTTSNICLRLGGTEKTKSHVLNYPDPSKKLLQRGNTTWFAIPTETYLENLKEIELWSDYTGRNPKWYCVKVTVYDLQTNRNWHFDVNSWFDLPPKHKLYKKIRVETRKKIKCFCWCRIWPRRSHQTKLTVMQKKTLLLSIVLTIFAICLVCYHIPRFKLNDGFGKFGNFEFNYMIIWVIVASSGVAFVAHIILTLFFRILPTLSWIILITNVIVAMSELVVLGFWVPTVMGWYWLTSVLSSLLIYFFIYENIFEFLISCVKISSKKKDRNFKNILAPLEKQRMVLFKRFGENLLRPYFRHLYRPLDNYEIKERKIQQQLQKNFYALCEDTIMFVCYVVLLYLAIYAQKNYRSVQNHEELIDLCSGEQTRTQSFTEIDSKFEFYKYLNETLFPVLHAQQWYSRFVLKEPGIMADFSNKILGVARLRLKRAIPKKCKEEEGTCRTEFTNFDQNRDKFGPEFNEFDRSTSVWNYTSATKAGLSVYVGKMAVYDGGGYLAPLGRTWHNSYVNLLYLINHTWLDSNTSAIFIEFLTYNVNSNLFNSIRIVVELSSTGYFSTELDLVTSQFLFINNEETIIQIAIFATFVIIVIVFTLKFLIKFRSFCTFWFFLDLCIVALSYACFALFVHRSELVKEFLEELETAKKNEFVNYFGLLYEDVTFIVVAAFLVFVATVRLWKVCRFGNVFRLMEKTVLMSFSTIFLVLFNHLVILLAYAFCGFVIYGGMSERFQSLGESLVSLSLQVIGFSEGFESIFETFPTFSKFFYMSFNFLNMVFLSIYICVIMIYYYEASKESEIDSDLKRLLYKEFLYFKLLLKVNFGRLRSGSQEKTFVTPKSDEFRFANCLTLNSNTLELMRCIVIYDLKKNKLKKEEKIALMQRVVRHSKDSKAVDVFLSEKVENFVKIIHDEKIVKVAKAVEKILSLSNEKYKEKMQKKRQKVMEKNLKKLKYIDQTLRMLTNIVTNIEIK